jgi:light-regulated signal transduction histidine kinase (bacteriophytochrome)
VQGRADAGRPFDAIVHRASDLLVVELEPATDAAQGDFRAYGADTHHAMMRLQSSGSLAELLDDTVSVVRSIAGYDRVMVYRFDEDSHGQVVAEDRAPALEPFLGLHYPASDIPAQARRLYVLNPLRIIPDIAYRRAELIWAPDLASRGPLDLTFSTLRSVSPIHVEYLRNMGVAASMSVSIVHDGKLWGLIACHHYTPRFVPYATRMTCELIGHMLSTLIQSWRLREEADQREAVGARRVRLLSRLTTAEHLATGLGEDPDDLLGVVDASGAAVLEDGRFAAVGTCPPEVAVRAFCAWLAREGHEFLLDPRPHRRPSERPLVGARRRWRGRAGPPRHRAQRGSVVSPCRGEDRQLGGQPGEGLRRGAERPAPLAARVVRALEADRQGPQ